MLDPATINPLALPSLPLANRRQLPNVPACYLVLEGETVIYVGRASSLLIRWLTHHRLKDFQSRGTEIRLAWLECSDAELLFDIENALLTSPHPTP